MLEQTAVIRHRRCSSRKCSTFFFFTDCEWVRVFPTEDSGQGSELQVSPTWTTFIRETGKSFSVKPNMDEHKFVKQKSKKKKLSRFFFFLNNSLHFSQILNMKHAALPLLWADFQKLSLIVLKKKKKIQGFITRSYLLVNTKAAFTPYKALRQKSSGLWAFIGVDSLCCRL